MSFCQNITQLKQQLFTDHCVSRGTGSNQHIYQIRKLTETIDFRLSLHWRNLPILTEWNLPILTEWNLPILTECALRMLGQILFVIVYWYLGVANPWFIDPWIKYGLCCAKSKSMLKNVCKHDKQGPIYL